MTLGRPLAGAEAIRRAVHHGGADGDVTCQSRTRRHGSEQVGLSPPAGKGVRER